MAVGVTGPSAVAVAGEIALRQSAASSAVRMAPRQARTEGAASGPRLHCGSVRRCSSARFLLVGVTVIASILASLALIAAPAALADGDPASDVLVNMPLFNPIDSGIPFSTVDRLEGLLVLSRKDGFPIRVAMINSATDLGTATAYWGERPQDYAYYLWRELQNLYGGQILVVMPNGFGLWGPPHGRYAVSKAELNVRALAPGHGVSLAAAAISAVPLLARADGHEVPAADHVGTVVPDVVGAGTPPAAWVALGLGVLLIAGCWRASLKARPLSLGRRGQP